MKRTAATLALVLTLFAPGGTALAAPGEKGGPASYYCSIDGSVYDGVGRGDAKKLERSGYVCARID